MDDSKKRLVMGVLLIFFMISSVFGVLFFGFNEGSTSLRYGDYNFKSVQNQWGVKIGKKKLLFEYHPSDVDNLNLSEETKNRLLSSRMIYITSDFNDTTKQAIAQAAFQLTDHLIEKNIIVVNAFTESTSYNTPIITCENATEFLPVLYFETHNITQIETINNCLMLRGESQFDFGRLRDRLLYAIYEIIP